MKPSNTDPSSVDAYLEQALLAPDPALNDILARSAAAGLPAHAVSPLQGAFLAQLVQIGNARRVLEIGTLGGYSTVWMARALPSDGALHTLEVDATCAAVARESFALASLADTVSLHEGPALETLDQFIQDKMTPFDLVFIDADKQWSLVYAQRAVTLCRPGATIVLDNVVRGGAIADPDSGDPKVEGLRAALEWVASHPKLSVTALQTLGTKGHDGFALVRVE